MTRTMSDPLVITNSLNVTGAVDFDSTLVVDGLVGLGTTPTANRRLNILAASASESAIYAQAAASATAPIIDLRDSANARVFASFADGHIEMNGGKTRIYNNLTQAAVSAGTAFVRLSPGVSGGTVFYRISLYDRDTSSVLADNQKACTVRGIANGNSSTARFSIIMGEIAHNLEIVISAVDNTNGVYDLKAQTLAGADLALTAFNIIVVEVWSSSSAKAGVTIYP